MVHSFSQADSSVVNHLTLMRHISRSRLSLSAVCSHAVCSQQTVMQPANWLTLQSTSSVD